MVTVALPAGGGGRAHRFTLRLGGPFGTRIRAGIPAAPRSLSHLRELTTPLQSLYELFV